MKRLFLICLALAALTCAATVAMAADIEAPEGPVEMKFPAEGNKYAPVQFLHHDGHLQYTDCKTCHHTWDGTSALLSCSSDGCHSDTSRENKREPTSYDSAFHARKADQSCVGCHQKVSKENKDSAAPTKCNDCHTRS